MMDDEQYYIVDRQHSHLLDDSIVMTDGGAGAGDYTLVYEGSWENQLCVVVSFFCTKIPVYQYRYLQWKD
jgi:hypothetical protein